MVRTNDIGLQIQLWIMRGGYNEYTPDYFSEIYNNMRTFGI